MECAWREPASAEEVEGCWRALEARARPGFFTSWTFLGCEVSARFPRPVLIAVRQAGEDLALGLLSRRQDGLHLMSGGGAIDRAVFPEPGGLLLREGAAAALAPALGLLAARGPVRCHGVDDAHLAAALQAGEVTRLQTRPAPWVDLQATAADPVAALSANARAQVRRALRLAPGAGVMAAPDAETALRWFEALVALHAARWREAGGGAFADPAVLRFHRALLARAVPRGEAEILRVGTAVDALGYLYVLRAGTRAQLYQSGFAPAADARHKPGLVCHVLAMAHYRAAGLAAYDLMAGDDRYKRTLAGSTAAALHWFTLHPKGSWRARGWRLAAGARARFRRVA